MLRVEGSVVPAGGPGPQVEELGSRRSWDQRISGGRSGRAPKGQPAEGGQEKAGAWGPVVC